MFLEIDKKNGSTIAVVDDSKTCVPYGDLCDFSEDFSYILSG